MDSLVVLVAILLMGHASSKEACATQPVCVTFAIDRTVNINADQSQQMASFIQGVTKTISEDSEGHLIFVNNEMNEVAALVVENEGTNYTYFYGQDELEPSGYIITTITLEQAFNVCFNESVFKMKPEVSFLLVSDLTKLQGILPDVLLWRDTFVVVFGSSIPIEFQSLAIRENHTHLIKDSDHVTTAVNHVSIQLCKVTACSTQPVCVTFAIDRTVNINADKSQQMAHFIQGVTATIPEDSEGHLIFVNNEMNEVAALVVENQGTNYTYFYGQDDLEPTGYIITTTALAQAANMCYTASFYENKAEIYFMLVSDLTKLQGFPPLLPREKTYVIVFGSSISNKFKGLASSGDHIHLIKDYNNVTAVVDRVSNHICKDITFHPISDAEVNHKETHSREDTLHTVPLVLSIVTVTVVVVITSLLVCCRKKLLCFASSGTKCICIQRRPAEIYQDTEAIAETVDQGNHSSLLS